MTASGVERAHDRDNNFKMPPLRLHDKVKKETGNNSLSTFGLQNGRNNNLSISMSMANLPAASSRAIPRKAVK